MSVSSVQSPPPQASASTATSTQSLLQQQAKPKVDDHDGDPADLKIEQHKAAITGSASSTNRLLDIKA